ncbi:MAG: hypothetical protein QOC99_675 [Acidobacteriota bacterium]|nr:hypothetical protein [Acidobacteriota bacterium]
MSGSQRKSGMPLIVCLISQGCSGFRSRCGFWPPLGPKLFCGVAFFKGGRASVRLLPRTGFALRATVVRIPSKETERCRRSLRHNICQRLCPEGRSRATPPHRQNYLSVALLGNGLQAQTRDYTDGARLCQAGPGIRVRSRKNRALREQNSAKVCPATTF